MPSLPSFAAMVRLPEDRGLGRLEGFLPARDFEETSALDARVETFRTPVSTQNHEDRIRLDQRAARESRDADCGARRIRLREISSHDLVDAGEMRQVGQIDGELDRIGERSTAGLGDGLQVAENAMDLVLDSIDELPGCRVESDLAGEIERVARTHGLGIGADRSRGIRSGNSRSCHVEHQVRGRRAVIISALGWAAPAFGYPDDFAADSQSPEARGHAQGRRALALFPWKRIPEVRRIRTSR